MLEVNPRITKDRRHKCIIPRQSNVDIRVLFWKYRYHRAPIRISKRDFEGIGQIDTRVYQRVGLYRVQITHVLAYVLIAVFGWRPSPANWGIMPTLLIQFVSPHIPNNRNPDGPESYLSFQYVDGGAFVESRLGLRPWQALSLWEFDLAKCLGPAVVHAKDRHLG